MRVKELSAWISASASETGFEGPGFEGDGERELRRVASLEEAGPDDLSFVTKGPALKLAAESEAGCLLVPQDFSNDAHRTIIRTRDPRAAVARAIVKLHPKIEPTPGVHPSAVIGPGSVVGPGSHVGPHVTIGVGVKIGSRCSIDAGSTIGDYVVIGDHCLLHPRVTVHRDTVLGDEVVLHSGCVIGGDGFGFVLTDGMYEKFPQIGRVEIGNRVEIGSNSCVDCAALGVTSIGDGTKIDNLVHIGHNCKIGRHVVIAAQTGLSGGVVVGDYAVIGGQVGIGDKARIEPRAILGSGSGVLTSKVVRSGEVMWGTPARPLKDCLEQMAVLSRLAKKKK